MNNYCLLIGRIANEIEITETDGNKNMANLNLAVTSQIRNSETGEYDVENFNIILCEHIAENTKKFCRKGDMVAVKSRLTSKSDSTNTRTEIVAERVLFLSSKQN